jgi:hypothetical protein
MTDVIELGGGPYIVKKNEGGGIEFRYGWAEINIVNGNYIKVICKDDEDEIRTILKFNIINPIPREYKILEKIQIYLKLGFNSIYAYNYSCVDRFKKNCEKYFRNLDEELSTSREKDKPICDKCNGTGIIKK